MKKLGAAVMLMAFLGFSCRENRFKGNTREVPSLQPTKVTVEQPAIPPEEGTPATLEPSETNIPLPQVPVEKEDKTLTPPPPAKDKVFTLELNKLKHDALFKNCLDMELDGKNYRIACNKDFTVQKPQVFTLSRAKACHSLKFTMTSFEPVDKPACIANIQANRDFHQCNYKTEALKTSVMGASSRFRVSGSTSTAPIGPVAKLLVEFEDSDGAAVDYNDYVFSVSSDGESYLKYSAQGVEYCTP